MLKLKNVNSTDPRYHFWAMWLQKGRFRWMNVKLRQWKTDWLPLLIERCNTSWGLQIANNTGVGAVLSPRCVKENTVHPCVYLSKRLSPAERNYAVGDPELLAIKVALEEWSHWLEGAEQPFLIWTDHKNLKYLKSAKRLNSHHTRWAMFFLRFNFTLSYRPGSKNMKPDILSHLNSPWGRTPGEASLTPASKGWSPGSWRHEWWKPSALLPFLREFHLTTFLFLSHWGVRWSIGVTHHSFLAILGSGELFSVSRSASGGPPSKRST